MNRRTPPARSSDGASTGEGQGSNEAVGLLLDDDPTLRAKVEGALAARGYRVRGAEALRTAPVLVVSPVDVVAKIAELRARARIDVALIVLSRGEPSVEAFRAGAHAVLRLPLSTSELVLAADRAFGRVSDRRPAVGARSHDWSSPVHSPMIGRISAALSHELGTPLAVMSMNLELVADECERLTESERLLREIALAPPEELATRFAAARAHLLAAPPPHELFEAMVDARGSLDRMRALLSQIKELGGRPSRTVAAVDLVVAMQEARRAAGASLQGVTVEEVIDPGTEGQAPFGMGNSNIIEAIIGNLLDNAAISAKQLTSPRVRLHLHASGDDAIVEVHDNGPGIDPEIQEKVFEPFYTTRRGQGGVGLGLSVSREYAQQIGARLTLSSIPGRGACFRLAVHRAK